MYVQKYISLSIAKKEKMEQFKIIRDLNKTIKKSPWCERQIFDEIADAVKDIFKEYVDSIDIANHYRYLGNFRKFKSLTAYSERLLIKLEFFEESGEWEVKAIIKNLYAKDKNSPYTKAIN